MVSIKKWAFLVVILSMIGIIVACSEADSTTEDIEAEDDAEVADAGEKELRVRFYDDPAGFDPAYIFRTENETIALNVYSGLVTYDSKTSEIIPDLAHEWEVDETGTEWTFKLREGVQFHKGYGELTSADIIYSYERIMDPEGGSPYMVDMANVENVEAPDDYTVVVHLYEPDANFLHVVANYLQGQIVNQEAVEEFGEDYRWNPIGTGPFVFDSYRPNAQIVLVRNEDYFLEPAPLSKITFNIIKDEETAAIALQNNEIDLIMRLNTQEALERLEEAGYKMNHRIGRNISVKMFNTEFEPLSDSRVRQAWAHAIDLQVIREASNPMLATRTYNILPESMPVYTEDVPVYEYDPEKAKALLAEAGYPDGFTVKQLGTAAVGVGVDDQLEQEFLKEVGINLEFELVDSPVYNTRRNAGEFEVAGRAIPALNPDKILFSYLHPDNIAPEGLNGARYHNPELMETLEAARAELDEDKRNELYKEVQQTAMTDLPYLPMYAGNSYWPSRNEVTGVDINGFGQLNFYHVDIER